MKGLLFTYILTYGGAFMSLFRPFEGLLIYVAFAILKPEALWHWSVPAGNYSRIVAIGLLLGWVLHGFGSWRLGKARPVLTFLLAFWGWLVLTAFSAYDPDVTLYYVESLSKVFLPFVAGLTLIDSTQKLKQLAWVIVLSQGYLAFEFNLTYLRGFFLADSFLHGKSDNNGVALTMVTGVGMAFFVGLHSSRLWQKGVAFAAAVLMAHFVLFSMSRGAMLGMVVTGCLVFVLIPKTLNNCLIFTLALAVGARLTGPSVVQRFSSSFAETGEREQSAENRLTFWRACSRAVEDRPIVGVGLGNWPNVTPQYGIKLGVAAHSTWFQVAAEMGIPGVAFLLLFYLAAVFRLWPLARESHVVADPALHYLARMSIVSIIAFVVSAQFLTLYGLDLPYYVNLVGAGVLKLCSGGAQDQPAPS